MDCTRFLHYNNILAHVSNQQNMAALLDISDISCILHI